jgi:cell division protein FtsB
MTVPRHNYTDRRSRLRQSFVVLLCFALTAYFAHHALRGRYGFEARQRLIERSSILEFEVRSLEAVRARLERDVALLAPEFPHPDLVEEIARDVLGYAHPDDRIVPGF